MTTWPYLMRPETAAAFLDMSPEQFRSLVRPYLRVARVSPKGPRFHIADLQAWADQATERGEPARLRAISVDR